MKNLKKLILLVGFLMYEVNLDGSFSGAHPVDVTVRPYVDPAKQDNNTIMWRQQPVDMSKYVSAWQLGRVKFGGVNSTMGSSAMMKQDLFRTPVDKDVKTGVNPITTGGTKFNMADLALNSDAMARIFAENKTGGIPLDNSSNVDSSITSTAKPKAKLTSVGFSGIATAVSNKAAVDNSAQFMETYTGNADNILREFGVERTQLSAPLTGIAGWWYSADNAAKVEVKDIKAKNKAVNETYKKNNGNNLEKAFIALNKDIEKLQEEVRAAEKGVDSILTNNLKELLIKAQSARDQMNVEMITAKFKNRMDTFGAQSGFSLDTAIAQEVQSLELLQAKDQDVSNLAEKKRHEQSMQIAMKMSLLLQDVEVKLSELLKDIDTLDIPAKNKRLQEILTNVLNSEKTAKAAGGVAALGSGDAKSISAWNKYINDLQLVSEAKRPEWTVAEKSFLLKQVLERLQIEAEKAQKANTKFQADVDARLVDYGKDDADVVVKVLENLKAKYSKTANNTIFTEIEGLKKQYEMAHIEDGKLDARATAVFQGLDILFKNNPTLEELQICREVVRKEQEIRSKLTQEQIIEAKKQAEISAKVEDFKNKNNSNLKQAFAAAEKEKTTEEAKTGANRKEPTIVQLQKVVEKLRAELAVETAATEKQQRIDQTVKIKLQDLWFDRSKRKPDPILQALTELDTALDGDTTVGIDDAKAKVKELLASYIADNKIDVLLVLKSLKNVRPTGKQPVPEFFEVYTKAIELLQKQIEAKAVRDITANLLFDEKYRDLSPERMAEKIKKLEQIKKDLGDAKTNATEASVVPVKVKNFNEEIKQVGQDVKALKDNIDGATSIKAEIDIDNLIELYDEMIEKLTKAKEAKEAELLLNQASNKASSARDAFGKGEYGKGGMEAARAAGHLSMAMFTGVRDTLSSAGQSLNLRPETWVAIATIIAALVPTILAIENDPSMSPKEKKKKHKKAIEDASKDIATQVVADKTGVDADVVASGDVKAIALSAALAQAMSILNSSSSSSYQSSSSSSSY